MQYRCVLVWEELCLRDLHVKARGFAVLIKSHAESIRNTRPQWQMKHTSQTTRHDLAIASIVDARHAARPHTAVDSHNLPMRATWRQPRVNVRRATTRHMTTTQHSSARSLHPVVASEHTTHFRYMFFRRCVGWHWGWLTCVRSLSLTLLIVTGFLCAPHASDICSPRRSTHAIVKEFTFVLCTVVPSLLDSLDLEIVSMWPHTLCRRRRRACLNAMELFGA